MPPAPHSYTEHAPAAPLRPYVACLWHIRAHGAVPRPLRVLPDGCVDLLWDERAREASFVGPMRTAAVVPLDGTVSVWGVRFRPGGVHPFLRAPLADLVGTSLAPDTLWSAACARELLEADAPSAREHLERWLLARLRDAGRGHDTAHTVRRAAGWIARGQGLGPVSELEHLTGWSARHLERAFQAHVGLGPKALARVVRLQHAAGLLQRAPETPGAALAADAGYADQAHLVREFRALAGVTPGAFAREWREVGFVQARAAALP